MKIAILGTFLGQKSGGAEMSAFYLSNLLKKEKHNFFAITAKLSEKMPFKTYSLNLNYVPNIVLMIGNSFINQIMYLKILKILKKEKPDIIHLQDFSMIVSSLKAAKKLNIPLTITVRDFRHQCNLFVCGDYEGKFKYNCSKKTYFNSLNKTFSSRTRFSKFFAIIFFYYFYSQKKLLNKTIKNVDSVISVSNFVKSSLILSGVNSKIIDTIYVPKPDWTIKNNNINNKQILFCAGLMVEAKGFQIAINALNKLKSRFPDIELRIAGEGPYKNNLIELVNKYNLKKNVSFLGKINSIQMKNEYAKANIVLQTSIIPESLSRIIFEAFSMKKPVISINSGGNRELVIDSKTGFLIPYNKNSYIEFADKIEYLLKLPHLAKEMGKEGFKLVNKNSSNNVVIKKHLEKYKKTIQNYNK